MRIVLEIENTKKLPLLLEFLKDLKYVKAVSILEKDLPSDPAKPAFSREEALKIVSAGCEMASFGDPVEFQRRTRADRNIPFGNE